MAKSRLLIQLKLGWRFRSMMEVTIQSMRICRLFFIIHSDHESACQPPRNSSGRSTLSTSTMQFSWMNALAGPLHGRANQKHKLVIRSYSNTVIFPRPGAAHFAWRRFEPVRSSRYGTRSSKTDPRFEAIGIWEKNFRMINFQPCNLVYEAPSASSQAKLRTWPTWMRSRLAPVHLAFRIAILCACGSIRHVWCVQSIGDTANAVWARALVNPWSGRILTTAMLEKQQEKYCYIESKRADSSRSF